MSNLILLVSNKFLRVIFKQSKKVSRFYVFIAFLAFYFIYFTTRP
jgi:hypothetical protein